MKRINKNYIISTLFVFSVMIGSLFNEISIIPRDFVKILNYSSLLLSVYCFYYLLKRKSFKNFKVIAILITLFLINGFISAFLNYSETGLYGFKKIILIGSNLFLFYFVVIELLNINKRSLLNVLMIIFILHAILVLISLFLWFFEISMLLFIEDRVRSVGIRFVTSGNKIMYSLLYGVFRDSNYAATLSVMSIIYSIRILTKHSVPNKNLILINILMQYIFVLLTNSRTNFYAVVILLFLGLLFYSSIKLAKNKLMILGSIILSILVSVAFFTSSMWIKSTLMSRINIDDIKLLRMNLLITDDVDYSMNRRDEVKIDNWNTVFYLKNDDNDLSGGPIDHIPVDKTDVDGKGNGRLEIWSEGLSLFKRKPVFGYATANLQSYASSFFNNQGKLANGFVLDNSYLDVLLAYGIFGFLLLFLYILSIFYRLIVNLVKNRYSLGLNVIFCIFSILFIFMTGFFYTDYFIGNILIANILFLSLAILTVERDICIDKGE